MTSGMTEQFMIATIDVALAGQTAVVAAESMGLGICYIGAVRNDPQTVSDLLELPRDVYPVFGLCLGWPDQDPEVKPRLPVEIVLKEDVYRYDQEARQIAEYDETMRDYYRSRTGGTKETCWTEEMAGLVDGERGDAPRDGDSVAGEQLLALVLVDIHAAPLAPGERAGSAR